MMTMCGFGRSDVVSFLFSFSENKKFVLQNHKTLCLMFLVVLCLIVITLKKKEKHNVNLLPAN